MKLKFTKMHGCGNDYIYIDCFDQVVENPEELSRNLSRYHFGIGGDGIILIEPSPRADGMMRLFNQDGSTGRMCGNGIRCVGKYLYDSGRARKEHLVVDTPAGLRTLDVHVKNGKATELTVNMSQAEFASEKVPVALPMAEVVDEPVMIGDTEYNITCVSMGNSHCVVFCDDVDGLDLQKIGPLFENAPIFPDRVNTEFIQVIDRHTLKMRVWERGSGETWACGTGACASAVAAIRCGHCDRDGEILVHLVGGDLKIRWTEETVWMTGPAVTVFTGEVEI